MVTPEAGLVAPVSEDVKTLNDVFVSAPAEGFVNPLMVRVPDVDAARAHVDFSVTTTVFVESVSVAPVQVPVNPVPIVTVDCAGMTTPDGNVTVIVDPELNAPVADVLKPTVQFVVVFAFVRAGANVTAETEVPAITMFEPESAVAVTSWAVATVKPDARIVSAAGLVNPVSCN